MGSILFKTFSFLKYLKNAKDEHSIHSPFIFNFYNNVILDSKQHYFFKLAEHQRQLLLRDNRTIDKKDFGASKKNGNILLSKLVKNSKDPKYCRILFRLIDYFNFNNSIELGTSVGISGSYIYAAKKKAKFFSLEGCPNTAAIAKETFRTLGLDSEKILIGEFDTNFEKTLASLQTVDFVFFDGNHQKKATIDYFNKALKYINNNSVFVFDDIYWSKDMSDAWKEIKNHPSVKITIDLFEIGIVFFRKEQVKQHFILKT